MAIAVRGTTWDPFNTLVRQFDADFDNLVRHAFGRTTRRVTGFVPAADVTRDGADVLVTLELPGIDAENNVDVEVDDGRLVISGRREESRNEQENGVLVREIRSGEFRREFALPDGVTGDQVSAEYERGLLKVRVRNVIRPVPQATKVKVRTVHRPAVEGTAVEGTVENTGNTATDGETE
ncbi:MAG: Hsp20/alpha crystallin family protein [Sciscionella sp.]|nr:Hsp20/alpha crystallin family protein [Sciscionella sp.]